MARGRKYDHTPVDSIRHADKRANIPTEELRDFVAEEEQAPTYTVYPRDPSLDPQLVWKGKDEQDSGDLEVPAVPIYVQEKVHPLALIENLRETARTGESEPELTLFDDYDGLEFEELIDFYRHEQNWANRLILGDSLLVMNSLAEKEGLRNQVQMVYMDPPYGIKFGSNWQVSTRQTRVPDGRDTSVTRQPEQVRAFRDTWAFGVNSYLTYLRDRLVAARSLLAETGSLFVQIGDENVHVVRCLMDEVFGPDNFVSLITTKKSGGMGQRTIDNVSDYVIWYAKDKALAKYRQLFIPKSLAEGSGARYNQVELRDGSVRPITKEESLRPSLLPTGAKVFLGGPMTSETPSPSTVFEFELDGQKLFPKKGGWKTNRDGIEKLIAAGRLFKTKGFVNYKIYFDDFPAVALSNLWDDTMGTAEQDKVYVVQTTTKVIERCMLMTTDPGDLVLDPTCGSGTTAYVAEKHGRRWTTIDTSRVALALARTRMMAAKYPYYVLADSPDGGRLEAELSGQPAATSSHSRDVRKGFVYRRIPHISLSSFTKNASISPAMEAAEIESIVARSSVQEMLFDQPYEDADRVRVTGPFSVESLSPHRMLDVGQASSAPRQESQHADFAEAILQNLRKAGIQNTRRDERIVLESVQTYAGEWINASGEYADAGGANRRVAISIGPEHGTVGSEQVKEAAKEAVRGIGFDLLVVLGFAFDAHAGETAAEISPDAPKVPEFAAAEASKQYGRLKVLLARMNPDLAMGDDLLKKTGAGNLFMVFGEPDVDVRSSGVQLVAEVKGIDVYDPTTGQVRSDSTNDIACWFIDTNYNGESFFVRHAYFTGTGDPYGKLKKALRADIDESTWSTLYSTVSRPFDRPATGRIAIKVINHYGDEVMKVYEV